MFTSCSKNKSQLRKRTQVYHQREVKEESDLGTDLFMLTEEIYCSYTQSHFPKIALQMDITADYMVMNIVLIPAKHTGKI